MHFGLVFMYIMSFLSRLYGFKFVQAIYPAQIQIRQHNKLFRTAHPLFQHNFLIQKQLSTSKDTDFFKLKEIMIDAIQNSDFKTAETAYVQLRKRESEWNAPKQGQRKLFSVYLIFLSLCSKFEHIPYVIEILEFMERYNIPISEQIYYTLIKCYADDGNMLKIYSLIQDMKKNKIPIRYRNFIPLIDNLNRKNNLAGFIETIKCLEENNLYLKSEEFSLFLQTVYRNRDSLQPATIEVISEILHNTSEKLIGMESIDMINVAKLFDDISYDQVKDKGILIQDKSYINGPILSLKDYENNGSIVALNAAFEHNADFIDDRVATPDSKSPSILYGPTGDMVHFIPTIFIDRNKRQQLASKLLEVGPQLECGATLNDSTSNARLVYISSNSSICPHCAGELSKFHITPEQRYQIRQSLYAATAEKSIHQTYYLEVKFLNFFQLMSCNSLFRNLKIGCRIRISTTLSTVPTWRTTIRIMEMASFPTSR